MASFGYDSLSIIYPSLLVLLCFSCLYTQLHLFSFSSTPKISTTRHQATKNSGAVGKIEDGLAKARAAIREASRRKRYIAYKNQSFIPRGGAYRNPHAFHQSHIEMQKRLKVWVYKEGEAPFFHIGPMKDIYSLEGQFTDEFESGKSPFLARHPHEAHVFFLPISTSKIVHFLYTPLVDYNRSRLQNVVTDYIRVVSDKYPFWNRSSGADHFFVSCHDWGPDVSTANPNLYRNLIRALCNANTTEGFKPSRDVSLVEIKVPLTTLGPPNLGQPPQNRSINAFFAGGPHGYVRELLFKHWKDKDDAIQVHEYLPKDQNYFKLMGRARYCLCPSGWEVASPRIVEAVHAGCVPVIVSDGYALPFGDVLDWRRFSVLLAVKEIPQIRKILEGISEGDYLRMQRVVEEVRWHFTLNRPAKPFDLLHMVLHSVWLRRLNVRLPM